MDSEKRKQILELIEESISTEVDTLNHRKNMCTKGVDPISEGVFRRTKKEFIEQSKKEVAELLERRKKYI